MSSTTIEPPAAAVPSPTARVLGPLGAFAAGAGPTALLGFDNGGYDVATIAGYTIIVWWLVFAGNLAGLLHRPALQRSGWFAASALAVAVVWGALSLGWSDSPERGLTEVVRLLAIAGSLVLGLSAVTAGHGRFLVGGVLAGLLAIVGMAVATRLVPDLVTSAWPQDGFDLNRLSWPVNYWNSLGCLAAMAIVLGPALSVNARTPWTSGLAVAFVPVAVLGLALTLSRGGIGAAVIGLVAAGFVQKPRLLLLRTLIAPALGAAVLIAAVYSRSEIPDAVGGMAGEDAGRAVLPLVLLVVLAVGLVQAGWHQADESRLTPRLPRPSRTVAGAVLSAGTVAIVLGFFAVDGPGRTGDAWERFKSTPVAEVGSSTSRLTSIGGNQRYQMWSGAWNAAKSDPVKGIGLGSWESWWNARRGPNAFVRNAHSEPMEVLAETGAIGFGALLVLLIAPLSAAVSVLRRRRRTDPFALVAVPVVVAFIIAISLDWAWQTSVAPVAAFLTSAVLLARIGTDVPREYESTRRRTFNTVGVPLALAVVALIAVSTSAIAMIAPNAVKESSAALAAGRTDDALRRAQAGAEAAPFTLSPALQRAAVLERSGRLTEAATAARRAAAREPRNWRPWFVLARIEAARGRTGPAVEAYRRARQLNPSSPLLKP